MTIALPFNRLSVGTGNQASRIARSSSWLNRRGDVRKDVEALFAASESSRSSETAAAIDAYPVASTSYLPARVASDYPGNSERTSSSWKGKGRALPSTDASLQRKVNEYVEEGHFQRPLSTFFSENARDDAASESSTSTASTSDAVTDISGSYIGQPLLSIDQLPKTPAEAVQLVNVVAQGPKALSRLRGVLKRLKACPPQIRIAALSAALAFPVVPSTQWHDKSVRSSARNAVFDSNGTRAGVILDDITFHNLWSDLWSLAGETLNLSPDVATRILKNILSFPLPKGKKLRVSADDSCCGKAMRTLLFLAGLEDNPALAVNVLGRLLQSNLYHLNNGASSSFGQLDTFADLDVEETLADINDIVLILQDLLRSGILSSTTVNSFKLSEVITQAPTMSDDEFKHILKQTLLRIILQYYVDHGEQRYISRVAGLLEFTDTSALKKDSATDRDLSLMLNVAKDAMIQLRMDPRYASAAGRILRQLVQLQGVCLEQRDNTVGENDQAAFQVQGLLRDYFKIVLTGSAPEIDLLDVAKEVTYLWQAAVQAKLLPEKEFTILDLPQLVCFLELGTRVNDAPTQSLSRQAATVLSDRLQEAIKKREALENDLVNDALASLLAHSTMSSVSVSSSVDSILKLYHFFKTSDVVPGGFSLQSKNLRSLVQMARSRTQGSPQLDNIDEDAIPSSSSIIDHFMRCRSSWQAVPHPDYTALAGALLDNGEYDASRQVMQQLLRIKEVPSLEDVEIALKILSRDQPDEVRHIISDAKEEGLLVEPKVV